jgi:chitin synthase
MDDQARCAPRVTDQMMLQVFAKRWGNYSSFKVAMDRPYPPIFTIHHFNGPVTYSSEGFLERNLGVLNPNFVSLLHGVGNTFACMSGSINPTIEGLFSSKAIATQAYSHNEHTIIAAYQSVNPMRVPSGYKPMHMIKQPLINKEEEEEPVISGGTLCIAGKFRSALDTLFKTLNKTQAWFIFCINPNDSQLPNQLNGQFVKGQVRSVGLSGITMQCVNMFEVNMKLEEFCDRYGEPLAEIGMVEGLCEDQVEQSRMALSLQPRDVVLGQRKVGRYFLICVK